MPALHRVFLVGPMGAGKTTIGKYLAQQLKLEFADTDSEIEARTGADIPWIFDVEGEDGFRDREQQVVEEMTQWDNIVLATGGGVVLRPENRRAWVAAALSSTSTPLSTSRCGAPAATASGRCCRGQPGTDAARPHGSPRSPLPRNRRPHHRNRRLQPPHRSPTPRPRPHLS